MFRFGEKVRKLALVELCLSGHAALEKLLPRAIEGPVEEGKERKSIFGENLLVEISDRSSNIHALQNRIGGSHHEIFCLGTAGV